MSATVSEVPREQASASGKDSALLWCWRWLVRFALVGATAYLCLYDNTTQQLVDWVRPTIWEVQNSEILKGWLSTIADASGRNFALFAGLGLLIAFAMRRPERFGPRVRCRLLQLAACAEVSAMIVVCQLPTLPAWHVFVVPFVGSLFGLWLGAGWQKSKLWFASRLFLLLVIFGGLAAYAGSLALSPQPYELQAIELTSAEKQRLSDGIRARDTDGSTDSGVLKLSQRDVKYLVAWWLGIHDPDRISDVDLGEGTVQYRESFPIDIPWLGTRYLNAGFRVETGIENGQLNLAFRRIQSGRIGLSNSLLNFISPRVEQLLRSDGEVQKVLKNVNEVTLRPEEIEIVGNSPDFRNRLFPSLLAGMTGGELENPDIVASTRSYFDFLIGQGPHIPRDDDRFLTLVRTAFQKAVERSQHSDPIVENRAVIYALTTLQAPPRYREMLKAILGTDLDVDAAARYFTDVKLRGRHDWTKHFWVSAAMTSLSGENVSLAVGVIKEQLDAHDGGSGYSFGDRLADLAGARFAKAATRDEASARALQHRLANLTSIDEIFPSGEGLPEGISQDELEDVYGGIDGERYKAVEAEIVRRLDEIPLLAPAEE